MDDGLKYWGKARPQSVVPCHPAAYHCLDVAACSYVLLERLPLLRRRLSILIDIDDPVPFLSALIALHDIGKFSRAFQAHVPALWGAELGDIADAPADPGHGGAGLWLWRDRLHHVFLDGLRLMPLARAVFGHHGTPIAEDSPPPQLRALYGRHGLARAEEFADNVVPLICPGKTTLVPMLIWPEPRS